MAQLLQTLNVATILGERYNPPNPTTGDLAYFTMATPAQLHDNNDSTLYHAVLALLAGLKTSGTAYVDLLFDPCTTTGVIEFVRWHLRAQVIGNPEDIAASHVQMDNSDINGPSASPITDTFANYELDISTFQGLPWTKTAIDSAGWFIEQPCAITAGAPFYESQVSECYLEIWGHPASSVSGYTSYEVGQFDVSSPENPVLPEVAKRIAQGDRRFMPRP